MRILENAANQAGLMGKNLSFRDNLGVKKAFGSLCVAAVLSGCATLGVGDAPGSERGSARSSKGEQLPTETLTPGVASALFPDPNWRSLKD